MQIHEGVQEVPKIKQVEEDKLSSSTCFYGFGWGVVTSFIKLDDFLCALLAGAKCLDWKVGRGLLENALHFLRAMHVQPEAYPMSCGHSAS